MTVADQVREAMGDLYARPANRVGIQQLKAMLDPNPRHQNAALVKLLGLPDSTKREHDTSMRRIQRYTTQAKQTRNPTGPGNEDIRARLNAVSQQLTREKMLSSDVTIFFQGQLSTGGYDPMGRSFDLPVEEPEEEALERFLDALSENDDDAIEEAFDKLVSDVYGGPQWHVEDAPELTFTVRPRAR